MTTEKQIQANRINALKGGVKTPAGKAKVRLNAVSHGFFAKDLAFLGEDRRLLEEFSSKLSAEVKPVGEMENLLLEIVISASWKIKRILHYEKRNARICSDYRYSAPDNIMRYINTLQRQIYKAVHELERIQKERIQSTPPTLDLPSLYASELSALDVPDAQPEK